MLYPFPLWERGRGLGRCCCVLHGDFYVFRAEAQDCLLGVVDCVGHGVPGALMTMIAHTVINVTLDTLGLADPARVLGQMDAQIRAMLRSDPTYAAVATKSLRTWTRAWPTWILRPAPSPSREPKFRYTGAMGKCWRD